MKTKSLKLKLRAVLVISLAGLVALSLPLSHGVPVGTIVSANQLAAQWTVMVFIDGDNNLEQFAVADFLEMAAVANSNQVNLVVQFDRTPTHVDDYGNWSHTLRFKLSQGLTPTIANALPPHESELPNNTETNMGHPGTLTSFVEWARRKYPANHYMLILWDHGDGWRKLHRVALQRHLTAARAIRMADASKEKSATEAVSFEQSIDAPHRAISMDETDQDRLFMREVQTALETSFPNKDLDVIGFDACLMQMVENSFAMRRVAKVMVGSEELEPGDGWQYDDWLRPLIAKPTMDEATLGKILVTSYEATYGIGGPLSNPRTTLSALDLRQGKIDVLAQAISDFADELTASLPSELANIRAARTSCTPYAPGEGYYGIDLFRFCEQLVARTSRQALRQKAQNIMELLANSLIVLQNYAGTDRKGAFGSHGVAIYFPASKSAYDADPYGAAYRDAASGGGLVDYPVEFVERHQWDNFLHAYFERVP